MKILSQPLNINFMGLRYYAFLFSAALIAFAAWIWISTGAKKFGTDFRGGHELIVQLGVDSAATASSIRAALEGMPDPVVQSFESQDQQFTIRIAGEDPAPKVKQEITERINKNFQGEVQIIQSDYVGPTIGQELRKKALIAVVLGLIGILGYISFRFEFAFALGVVIALFHDVIVTFGFYLFAGHTINMATLAAALTIVGYSANDTIVIFDRVREEILKRQRFDLLEVMNIAINTTMSRTLITSITTLFSAAALLIFGGGAINDLAFFLVVGVVAGAYSTIFIAAPVALLWDRFRHPEKVRSHKTDERQSIVRGEVQV